MSFDSESNTELSPVLFHIAGIGEIEAMLDLGTDVYTVKRFANEACSFDLEHMLVMYNGKELEDTDTLRVYGINAGPAVQLLSMSNETPRARASKQVEVCNPFRAPLSSLSSKSSHRHSKSPKRSTATPLDALRKREKDLRLSTANIELGATHFPMDVAELGLEEVTPDSCYPCMDLTPGLKVYSMEDEAEAVAQEDGDDILHILQEVMWVLLNRGRGRPMLQCYPVMSEDPHELKLGHIVPMMVTALLVLQHGIQASITTMIYLKTVFAATPESTGYVPAVEQSAEIASRAGRRRQRTHPLLRNRRARKYHGKF